MKVLFKAQILPVERKDMMENKEAIKCLMYRRYEIKKDTSGSIGLANEGKAIALAIKAIEERERRLKLIEKWRIQRDKYEVNTGMWKYLNCSIVALTECD